MTSRSIAAMVLRRRLWVLAVAVVVALVATVLTLPQQATAHGVTMVPGSRTFLCWKDGLRDNGQIIPYNPACAAAVAQGGTNPLYNWFGVLRSDANGRTSGYIPDGQICGAGTTTYAAYNAARTDWPTTHLTSGANIQIRHSNWAAHPGRFDLYVTRNGWNPSSPLAWSDLEKFNTVTDPPQSGGAGALNYYHWNAQLPSGKTGRHIIFAHWIRSDSQENFYSCSDVLFDGGNGEVTGVGPGGTPPPTTPPPNTPTPTNPPTTPPPGPLSCTATVTATNTWSNGFQGAVTIKNNGTTPINQWFVQWSMPMGITISQSWNGTHMQSGPTAMIHATTWNATLAPGATATAGFLANGGSPTFSDITCG
ncbi:lytic polysaccharide monooxygenase [Streptosporangium sp. KLBMP 9127]|nr:lytic polysaccharide monooxygenase [Streptosporangium sp. KLBMP 9127]